MIKLLDSGLAPTDLLANVCERYYVVHEELLSLIKLGVGVKLLPATKYALGSFWIAKVKKMLIDCTWLIIVFKTRYI